MLRFINDAYADVYEISGGRYKQVASATAWTSAQTATGVVAGILTDVQEVIALYYTTTSGSTGNGDVPVRHATQTRIIELRNAQGHGTYSVPKLYSVTPMATSTAGDVNKLQLDYWPSVTGFYFPMWYIRQFAALAALTSSNVPDVNDLESRDVYLMAAAKIAPLIGRAELVPSILADVSSRTAAALNRKLRALISGNQD